MKPRAALWWVALSACLAGLPAEQWGLPPIETSLQDAAGAIQSVGDGGFPASLGMMMPGDGSKPLSLRQAVSSFQSRANIIDQVFDADHTGWMNRARSDGQRQQGQQQQLQQQQVVPRPSAIFVAEATPSFSSNGASLPAAGGGFVGGSMPAQQTQFASDAGMASPMSDPLGMRAPDGMLPPLGSTLPNQPSLLGMGSPMGFAPSPISMQPAADSFGAMQQGSSMQSSFGMPSLMQPPQGGGMPVTNSLQNAVFSQSSSMMQQPSPFSAPESSAGTLNSNFGMASPMQPAQQPSSFAVTPPPFSGSNGGWQGESLLGLLGVQQGPPSGLTDPPRESPWMSMPDPTRQGPGWYGGQAPQDPQPMQYESQPMGGGFMQSYGSPPMPYEAQGSQGFAVGLMQSYGSPPRSNDCVLCKTSGAAEPSRKKWADYFGRSGDTRRNEVLEAAQEPAGDFNE